MKWVFGEWICSDYIKLDVQDLTVNFDNQDWYVPEGNDKEGDEIYDKHLVDLCNLIGVRYEDIGDGRDNR